MEELSIKALESKALSLPDLVKQIEVKDDNSLKRANKALVYIKSLRKKVDEKLGPVIKKLNEAKAQTLNLKKEIEKPLIESEDYIKPQIYSYMAKLEQKRKEEELKEKQKLEAKTAFGKIESEVKVVVHKEKPKLHGTYIRKDWKWELEDFDMVPREWLCLDNVKISSHVRTMKEKAKIPGIRTYQKDTVASRSDF